MAAQKDCFSWLIVKNDSKGTIFSTYLLPISIYLLMKGICLLPIGRYFFGIAAALCWCVGRGSGLKKNVTFAVVIFLAFYFYTMSKQLVVIPTYNEKENIEGIVRRVLALPEQFDLLVVDDNSPDGTARLALGMQAEYHQRLFVLERSGKLGLGTAYIAGFRWALERGYDYVCEMDADFSHNPDDLPRLLAACHAGADLAIGSRYVSGINVINWPMNRVLTSYYGSAYVRKVLGIAIRDVTAGFKCYNRRLLSAINFDRIRMKGYGFQIEMKYTALRLGFKIVEVPIIFVDRKLGATKMGRGIIGEALWGVLKLRFANIMRRHGMR
jgi:dolichol-phosphate mannosyltransferase